MSKARIRSDVERTATMFDLLHREYASGGVSLRYVVVEEVSPGTGFSAAKRWADVLALSMWPSDALALHGYEIKASRADLKRELADLSKHQAVARYCDSWTLVAWDQSVLVDSGIPEWWGITITADAGDGERKLTTVRQAKTQTPEPWPRAFTCSLVRNAFVQSPGAAHVARVAASAAKDGIKAGKEIADARWQDAAAPLKRALFGERSWSWPSEATNADDLFRLAAERLTQLPLTSESSRG